MMHENQWPSAGRDPRLDKKDPFTPLEEFPDARFNPEEQVLAAETDVEEDEDESLDTDLGDEEAGTPPPDGTTQYDRLIERAHAEDAPHAGTTEVPALAEALQEEADATTGRSRLDFMEEERKLFSKLGNHGRRGRENPGKHMKGGESTRDNNFLS